jgi:hypothetical protein
VLGAAYPAATIATLHALAPASGLRGAASVALAVPAAAAGVLAGVALGMAWAVLRALPQAGAALGVALEPLTRRLAERTLGEGMPIAQFEALLGEELPPAGPEASAGFRAARWLRRRLSALARRALVGDFLDRLRARGESRVGAAAVEAYAREQLVGLVVAQARGRLRLLRAAVFVLTGALVGAAVVLRLVAVAG